MNLPVVFDMSPKGQAVTVHHEAVVLRAYRCPAGHWTIGVGHTSMAGPPHVYPGMVITYEEAMEIFRADVRRFVARVRRDFDATLGPDPQAAFDGAVSFDFNTGRIHNATWVRLWAKGETAVSRASFMQWTRGGGRVLRGLVRRREDEAMMIFEGRYPAVLSYDRTPVPANRPLARWVVASTFEQRVAARELLTALGYDTEAGLASIMAADEISAEAVRRFQADHGLTVDALIGRATLATLEREQAARKKALAAGSTAAAGGGTAAGGEAAAEIVPIEALDPAIAGWAGLALLAIGAVWLAYLAWHYRDAIAARIHRRAPRAAAWLRSF